MPKSTVPPDSPTLTPESARLVGWRGAAERLNIGRTGIWNLLAQGKLKAVKLGRRTLIPMESIDAFVANLPEAKFGQSVH